MQITKVLLKQWSACRDGYQWFIAKFPAGEGSYHDIVVALYDDKRAADARWLSAKCFEHFGDEFLPVEMASIDAVSASIINAELPEGELNSSGDDARIGSSGNYAQIGSSGNYAQIGSSGYGARIGSSGNYARIGSSGNDAQIGSSGNGAQIGSSGYGARIGSSGNYARIGSSGDDAQIEATGKNAVVAAAATVREVMLGEGGCAAIAYHDGTRTRFALAYVGENGIEAGVKYRLNDQHQFEAVIDDQEEEEAA